MVNCDEYHKYSHSAFQCLQGLMFQESSPIIDYYPEDFSSDLNGKQQDWEAVVLIPFIDEKRLLEAMEPFMQFLTPDEKRRKRFLVIKI